MDFKKQKMEICKKTETKDLNSLQIQPSCEFFIKESFSGLKSYNSQHKEQQKSVSLKLQNRLSSFPDNSYQHQQMITTTQNENKRQQSYILTENQMLDHLKRDSESEENRTIILKNKERKFHFAKWVCPRLCKQFIWKLKRNNQYVFHNQFQTELNLLQQNKFEMRYKVQNDSSKSRIGFFEKVMQIFTFFLFSIGFPFNNIYTHNFYIVIQFIVSLVILLKIIAFKKYTKYTWNSNPILQFASQQCVSISTFILSIISIFLWFYSSFQSLSYTNLIFLIIAFKSQHFQQIFITLIHSKKIYSLFVETNIIKVIINILIYSHLLACILCKHIISSPTQNWLHQSLNIQNGNEIYGWSFNQALSTFFSAGVNMPNATTSVECISFIFIRIIVFLLSLSNLKLLGNYLSFFILQKQRNKIKHLETLKKIGQNTKIEDKIYNQLTNILERDSQRIGSSFHSIPNQQKNWLSKNLTEKDYINLMKEETTIFQSILPALSKKMSLNISKIFEYQYFSTNQIISDFNKTYDFLILVNGKTINTSNKSSIHFYNGLLQVDKNYEKNQLLNKSFLTKKFQNYRIKCLSQTIVGRIKQQNFRNCLKDCQFDFQYVFSQRDKHFKFADVEGTMNCNSCSGMHTLYTCPYFHYTPFKSKIIFSHLAKSNLKVRRSILYLNERFIRIKSSTLKTYSIFFLNQKLIILGQKYNNKLNNLSNLYPQSLKITQKTFESKIQSILQRKTVEICKKLYQKQLESDQIWTLHSDRHHNYRYYFKNYNVDNIQNMKIKKQLY